MEKMMHAVCILGSPRNNGSTASIVKEVIRAFQDNGIDTVLICLGDADIHYCRGCRICSVMGKCVQRDDMDAIITRIFDADIVVIASPSYWGDVTGQMKVFFDRCTPYCNTNTNRTPVPTGKTGAGFAIRAGQSKAENEHLLATMAHFLGHLDIPMPYRFTIEGVNREADLTPDDFARAYAFGEEIAGSV